MPTFTPLTPEQYQAARTAGFSPEQIVANESKRKASADPAPAPETPWSQRQDSSFTWKVSPEELQSGDVSPVKSVVRPFVNLLGLPLQTAENLAKIPVNAYNLAKDQGASGIGNAALEAGKTLISPVLGAAKYIYGAADAAGDYISKKITGKEPIQSGLDEEAAKTFHNVNDAVAHPLDTATKIAQGVYQTSQENPMNIPLALEGGAESFNKMAGRDVIPSPISTGGQLVTKPVNATLDYITRPLKNAAIDKRAADFEKVFNMSKTTSAGELKYGKDSPQFAAQLEGEGVDMNFGRDERGRLDTSSAQSNVADIAERDNALMNKLLKDSNAPIDLNSIEAGAKEAAKIEYKGTAQNVALKNIEDEMAAYRQQYGAQALLDEGPEGKFLLPADVANDVKKDLWSKSKFSPFANETENTAAGTKYLMGQEIKGAIEDVVGGDNIVGRLNKRLGDIAQLQKVLQRSQGGAVHGGFMGRMFSRVIGGVAGSGGGPAGTIVGAITGDMIADALSNPNRPFTWAKMVIDRATSENPKLLSEVEARLNKSAADRLAMPRLPAPSYMEMGPETPRSPEPPTIFGQTPDQYYENMRRQNTPQLPAGNPNMVQGETVRLKAPYSQEPQSQSIFGATAGSTQKVLPRKPSKR